MNMNEIKQILKNIPDELYEVHKYGKLLNNIKADKFDSVQWVTLYITLSTGTIVARVQVYDDMDFTFKVYNENMIVNNSKIYIKNAANRIKYYLTILGFNCITL